MEPAFDTHSPKHYFNSIYEINLRLNTIRAHYFWNLMFGSSISGDGALHITIQIGVEKAQSVDGDDL